MKKRIFTLALICTACMQPSPVDYRHDAGVAHAATPAEIAAMVAIATSEASGNASVTPPRRCNIMGIGDSTTLDAAYATGGAAYRSLMFNSAAAVGINLTFVGKIQSGPNVWYAGGFSSNGGYKVVDTAVNAGPIVWHEGFNGHSIVATYSGGTNATALGNDIPQYQFVSEEMPDVAIFWAGYNDAFAYGSSGATADWGTAAGAVVDLVHTQSPNTRIIWANITIVGTPYNDTTGFAPYRARIATAAVAGSRSTYVTYTDLSQIPGWVVATDTVDGLHPSVAGYIKINTYLWPIVKPFCQ